MIRISRKCQYALRAVFELAARDSGRPVKIHRLAAVQNIPPRFLEVILNELRHAGLVESRRGSLGGYMLARPAEQLTVGQVIECVQGPVAAEQRRGNPGEYYYGDKAFGRLWEDVAEAVCRICENTSFAELVESERRSGAGAVADYAI